METGDRIGIWSPNCVEWVLVQYATAKVGVILVNINPAYRTSEPPPALNQSGCRMLVAAQSFKTSNYEAMIEEVRPDLPGLEKVILLGTESWDELVAGAASVSAEALRERSAELQFDDPINIQYTSGTTGFPKGATLSHHNILNNGYFIGEACRYTEADRVCIPVKEFCKGKIAHYKVPRYIKFTDEFPMTVTGKIQKFKMREQAVEELGLQAAAGMQTA